MSTLSVQNITGILNLNQVGTINAAVVKANTRDINGWSMLAPATSIGTGTNFTYNSIPPGYAALGIMIGGIRHNHSTDAYLIIETSNNNGSTWHTGTTRISDTLGTTSNTVTFLEMLNADGSFGEGMMITGSWGLWYWRFPSVRNNIANISDARVSLNGGSFLAGTIALYGKKYQVS